MTTHPKTGPWGTELIARPKTNVRGGVRSKPVTPTPAAELTGFDLRQAVEGASRGLASESGEQAERLRHALAEAQAKREQFWVDTCREVWQMRTALRQAVDYHARYGCRFVAPSTQQVGHVLSALDAALPFWDRDHPELFFQTLELNFPELVRAGKNQFRR